MDRVKDVEDENDVGTGDRVKSAELVHCCIHVEQGMVEHVMVEHVMVVNQTMVDWTIVNQAMVVIYYVEVEVTEERRRASARVCAKVG